MKAHLVIAIRHYRSTHPRRLRSQFLILSNAQRKAESLLSDQGENVPT